MSDAKTDYTTAVNKQKNMAIKDSIVADFIQNGYARKTAYGEQWEVVDINDVVADIAPGAKPVVAGGKIIYYNSSKTLAVVADVSGYLRVQDLTRKTRKRQYLDRYGKNAHNIKMASGKTIGRTKDEFQRATHYLIKKRT